MVTHLLLLAPFIVSIVEIRLETHLIAYLEAILSQIFVHEDLVFVLSIRCPLTTACRLQRQTHSLLEESLTPVIKVFLKCLARSEIDFCRGFFSLNDPVV